MAVEIAVAVVVAVVAMIMGMIKLGFLEYSTYHCIGMSNTV